MKPTRLPQANHVIISYAHTPEYGISIDEVLKPEYWSHVAKSLRPGYVVFVTAADMSWRAELMVRDVTRNEALMGVVSHVKFGAAVDLDVDEMPYELKWRGPARKFSVLRKTDGDILKDEFPTKELASEWAKNHMKAMAI